MTKTHELSRKEMKGPDQFQQVAGAVAGWIAAHQKQIVAAVVAALGVVTVAMGVSLWSDYQGRRAGAELAKVLDALQGDVGSAPVKGSSRPLFKTDEERQRAVVAAAGEVRAKFPSSEAAATAMLASGDAHLRLNEWDQAVADYQAFLSSSKGGSWKFAALDGTARAYEGKGDLAQAVQTWERVRGEVPFYQDRAEIERARLLIKMGKNDDARKVLTGFDEAHKESLLKLEAQKLLAKLGGK